MNYYSAVWHPSPWSVHHGPQDRAVQTQTWKPTGLQVEDAWLRCSSWKQAMLSDFP